MCVTLKTLPASKFGLTLSQLLSDDTPKTFSRGRKSQLSDSFHMLQLFPIGKRYA